ncbi:hypothetical protein VOLCADRAFT_96308 [Volvox carteri f. nagariensis]|uniref:Uncharacterized protein n=1 Tax=Volvox carteri f. nagariensis TaxID=3068 RepID=D8U9S0_VOLCA|nr:uncharacterized protein VOLCADRAFT_96308 [Volvox carteri f. nagariensis]EFJ43458.1 hypothetical protein VOLCADRAFT_96308 [Volvox carteri f. nagariensis]|eukprot:XP_002955387.1 hypothetical protein VOLCADRAFT_96308 [Volvox carteri f. nagariensis]
MAPVSTGLLLLVVVVEEVEEVEVEEWDLLSTAHCLAMEVAVVSALFLTIFFWVGLVAISREIPYDTPSNYMRHAGNSGLALAQVVLTRLPIVSYHFTAVLMYLTSYAVFLWIYGEVAGIWRYRLNWERVRGVAGPVVLVVLAVLVFLFCTNVATATATATATSTNVATATATLAERRCPGIRFTPQGDWRHPTMRPCFSRNSVGIWGAQVFGFLDNRLAEEEGGECG